MQAVRYLELAGKQSVQRSGNAEAARHFAVALDLLRASPEFPDRLQHELDLQLALGLALTAMKGWADTEVETAYNRAQELCQQIGDVPRLFGHFAGFGNLRGTGRASDDPRAGGAAARLGGAGKRREPASGSSSHARRDDVPRRGIRPRERARRAEPRSLRCRRIPDLVFQRGGYDMRIACGAFLSWTVWSLGYPDQALATSRRTVGLSRELAHPFSAVFALTGAMWLHQLLRDREGTREDADAVIALAAENGFVEWGAWAVSLRGWALSALGAVKEGLYEIRKGLAAYQSMGIGLMQPHALILLAEVYGEDGQLEAALSTLDEAVAFIQRTGEAWCQAEAHRLRGELLLRQGAGAEAERCFRQAIDVARRQQAKSLELRAATSLGRLLDSRGERATARSLLAEIHGWFTEGFDTADLKDAKTLLDELST